MELEPAFVVTGQRQAPKAERRRGSGWSISCQRRRGGPYRIEPSHERKKRKGLYCTCSFKKVQLDGCFTSPHLTMFERDGARLVRRDLRASSLVFRFSPFSPPLQNAIWGVMRGLPRDNR